MMTTESESEPKMEKRSSLTLGDLEDVDLDRGIRAHTLPIRIVRSNPNDAAASWSEARSTSPLSAAARGPSSSLKSPPPKSVNVSSGNTTKTDTNKNPSSKTATEWEATYNVFNLWDTDGDGTIESTELEYGIKMMFLNSNNLCPYLSYTTVSQIVSEVRLNESDTLDRKDFGYFFFKLAKAAEMSLEELALECSRSILGVKKDNKKSEDKNKDDKTNATKNKAHEFDYSVSSDLSSQIPGFEKMQLLFDLIDLDNNGSLDIDELAMSIREFRQATDLKITTAECLELLDEIYDDGATDTDDYDDNSINAVAPEGLDRTGFGVFMSRFSLVSGIPLDDLITSLLEIAEESARLYEQEIYERRHDSGVDTEEFRVAFKNLPELFSIFDEDDSGTLDRSELTAVMRRMIDEEHLTITFSEVMDIFREVDMDGNLELDVREFSCFLLKFAEIAQLPLEEIIYLLMNQAREYQQEILNESSFSEKEKQKAQNPLDGVAELVRTISHRLSKSNLPEDASVQSKEEEICSYLPFGAPEDSDDGNENNDDIQADDIQADDIQADDNVQEDEFSEDNGEPELFGNLNFQKMGSAIKTVFPVARHEADTGLAATSHGGAKRAQAA